MRKNDVIILGAGMTGLAAGYVLNSPVYESNNQPGGICSSYYVRPGDFQRLKEAPSDGEAYRFEIGGGHWIFGGDPFVLRFIRGMVPMKSYHRRSSVYFNHQDLYVPYPLQNHLGYLGKDMVSKALTEMMEGPRRNSGTMAEWLEQSFGQTLTRHFFAPFHELYTAGLWTQIAPQDAFKSPVDFSLAIRGAFDQVPPVGYNVSFVYPQQGLDTLAAKMSEHCQVHYGKIVKEFDIRKKEIYFSDGSSAPYKTIISTLPLNQMVKMTNIEVEARADPYTSVLVLNIGATRGDRCPDDHWLYNPDSHSGFHRIGFYSNVDVSFLPLVSRASNQRVSIYVERAYPAGTRLDETALQGYKKSVIDELKQWGYIDEVEVVDPTWIDVAYTWSWPGSSWKQQALRKLDDYDIYQIGRYGRWSFQGIADSIRDGLMAGGTCH